METTLSAHARQRVHEYRWRPVRVLSYLALRVVALPVVALLAVACAGNSQARQAQAGPGTGRPSPGSQSAAGAGSARTGPLNFAYCMQTHGVPRFPHPDADGGFEINAKASGIDPESPDYQAALGTCGQVLTEQLGPGPQPAGAPQTGVKPSPGGAE
jgi:hypothetical protein